MSDLYIFGAGELAKITQSYFIESGSYRFRGFILDDEFMESTRLSQVDSPVFAFSEVVERLTDENVHVFVAISAARMNRDRQDVFLRLEAMGANFASYISPYAFVSPKALIGKNVMIFENNVVQNGVEIGSNTILWSGNHIGHQTSIGAHCFFSSHVVISGYCQINENCYFGVNSTVVDHIRIAPGTLVGAASLITRDTEEDSIYVGAPAKKVPEKSPFDVKFR